MAHEHIRSRPERLADRIIHAARTGVGPAGIVGTKNPLRAVARAQMLMESQRIAAYPHLVSPELHKKVAIATQIVSSAFDSSKGKKTLDEYSKLVSGALRDLIPSPHTGPFSAKAAPKAEHKIVRLPPHAPPGSFVLVLASNRSVTFHNRSMWIEEANGSFRHHEFSPWDVVHSARRRAGGGFSVLVSTVITSSTGYHDLREWSDSGEFLATSEVTRDKAERKMAENELVPIETVRERMRTGKPSPSSDNPGPSSAKAAPKTEHERVRLPPQAPAGSRVLIQRDGRSVTICANEMWIEQPGGGFDHLQFGGWPVSAKRDGEGFSVLVADTHSHHTDYCLVEFAANGDVLHWSQVPKATADQHEYENRLVAIEDLERNARWDASAHGRTHGGRY